MHVLRSTVAALALVPLLACGNPVPGEEGAEPSGAAAPAAPKPGGGEPIKPPFAVSGDADGLLLVWFDAEGVHTASRRSDIPEAHRKHVRVSSLQVAPEDRLDPAHVYVADLRQAGADGSYPVRKHAREAFDALVDGARPDEPAASGVTLYMASWCGACRSAAAYLRSRGVEFVEKDIEKDASASAEMQRKAKAAGKTPRGVPVIDFQGEILLGFDKARLGTLIDRAAQ